MKPLFEGCEIADMMYVMKRPLRVHTVNEIRSIDARGPWTTKSGGELKVLFSLPAASLKDFLDFDNPVFSDFDQDIRGIRSYVVSGIAKDSVGANEVHLARTELVTALNGRASWVCCDLLGNKKSFILDGTNVLIVPSGILHTYKALEDDTRLQVIANTLFVPEDPSTHDSYPAEEFYALQRTLER